MPVDPDYAPEVPQEVQAFLRCEIGSAITAQQPLKGGQISFTRRLTAASGVSLILKQSRSAPDDMYALEADGLRTLRAAGTRTPQVFLVAPSYLLMEDLGAAAPAEPAWEDFGRMLAHQHQHTSDRFGFAHDNYLGVVTHQNSWTSDGWQFFAQHRVLRYLDMPLCLSALTADDRRAVEKLMARLPELIPAQPAALLHGDLWYANMLFDPSGAPAVIDPAVYYGWPEAELSMTYMCGKVPTVFFDAYHEVRPLAPGWRERMPLLHNRELISMVAHFGNQYGSVDKLRALLAEFS